MQPEDWLGFCLLKSMRVRCSGWQRYRGSMLCGRINEPAIRSVQKHRPIERIALDGLEAGVADDATEFFFGGAVTCSSGSDYVLFEHD